MTYLELYIFRCGPTISFCFHFEKCFGRVFRRFRSVGTIGETAKYVFLNRYESVCTELNSSSVFIVTCDKINHLVHFKMRDD